MLVSSHPGYLAVLLLINSLTSWNALAAELYIFSSLFSLLLLCVLYFKKNVFVYLY